MKIDPNCRYRSSHEYARKEGAEIVIGISDDIVFQRKPDSVTGFDELRVSIEKE